MNYKELSDINTFLLKVDRYVSLRDEILSHKNSRDGKRKYGTAKSAMRKRIVKCGRCRKLSASGYQKRDGYKGV